MNDEFRRLLIATARAVGADPMDLATVMSFESGFDPDVWGGAGGRHFGLIQFGPSERATYGVDTRNPLASQMGPNGAVAKYLRDRGFKPGMGLLDLYSTINAGAPGLYGASDAANGGTWGTVRDKVESQMGPHRQKAAALMTAGLSPGALEFVKDNPQPGGYSGLPDPNTPGSGWDTGSMPGGPMFGSMSSGMMAGGPPPGAGEWAFSDDKKGGRLSAAGKAFDSAMNEYPAPRISGGGGDARQSGNALLKLLMGNPSALAQSLLSRRLA